MREYQLGRHLLIEGDCNQLDLKQYKADAIVCDPPYGISHDTDYTRFTGGVHNSRNYLKAIEGDNKPFNPQPLLDVGCKTTILWGANNYSHLLPPGANLIWDKRYKSQTKSVMSDGEMGWVSRGHGVYIFSHYWSGFLRESQRGQKTLHPTEKPVALFNWVLGKYTKPDNLVLDPYAGSGPILLACETINRRCVAIEIEPEYCQIIIQRWERMTNQTAQLIKDTDEAGAA